MAVVADAQADQVDRAAAEELGVARALRLRVVARFDHVDRARPYGVPELVVEEAAEPLGRVRGQADVLVHVEDDDPGPVDPLGRAQAASVSRCEGAAAKTTLASSRSASAVRSAATAARAAAAPDSALSLNIRTSRRPATRLVTGSVFVAVTTGLPERRVRRFA